MSHLSYTIPRILLAEDDLVFQKLVVSFLSNKGYEVVGVATAAEFWFQFEQFNPDLVLLDLMLPDGSGYSLVHRIRAVDKIIPVIILTGLDTISDRELGLTAGADSFLTKPVSFTELDAIVKRAIVRQISINQLYKGSLLLGRGTSIVHPSSWLLVESSKCLICPKGRILPLNPMEFDFLYALVSNDGKVLRQLLGDKTDKGIGDVNYNGALSTLVCRLKKRWLDISPKELPLRSLRGQGYVFSESISMS